MKYICILIVGILTILLNSCNSNILLINGTYSEKNDSHILVFLADSTFKYEHRTIWYSESSGTWQKRGNAIYLNSFEQRNEMPIEYAKIENNQKKLLINIKVNSPDKPERDYICWPFVNGNFVYFDPDRGSYSFESDVFIDSIYFKIKKSPFVFRGTGYKMGYDDVKTKTIYPHLYIGESLDVKINIIDSLFGYTIFKDEKVEIEGKKIILKKENKKYELFLKK